MFVFWATKKKKPANYFKYIFQRTVWNGRSLVWCFHLLTTFPNVETYVACSSGKKIKPKIKKTKKICFLKSAPILQKYINTLLNKLKRKSEADTIYIICICTYVCIIHCIYDEDSPRAKKYRKINKKRSNKINSKHQKMAMKRAKEDEELWQWY